MATRKSARKKQAEDVVQEETNASIPLRPRTRDELRAWVKEWLGITLGGRALIEGHQSPLDYLEHTFFEGKQPAIKVVRQSLLLPPGASSAADANEAAVRDAASRARSLQLPQWSKYSPQANEQGLHTQPIVDAVVWANRGGGKTLLGAIATLLDLVYKDGIRVRILGGSMEQSQRMHEHLRGFMQIEPFSRLLEGKITDRRIGLVNKSEVELLAQSQTSVRGTRVQKLRCDEVELFDPDVWEAAQLVTRSRQCGEVYVRGAVECLSTMHIPQGIMHDLVTQALLGKRKLFKWGVLDVLEHCEPERPCATCVLLPECGGRAKEGSPEEGGHISIDDAVVMKARVVQATWETEMLCIRTSRNDTVFPEFRQSIHVVDAIPPIEGKWIGGMDFGFRAPTVVLWAMLDPDGVVWVDQEWSMAGELMRRHVEELQSPTRPRLEWIAVDIAGGQQNEQTGASNIELLKRTNVGEIRFKAAEVATGLLLIRARLRSAAGGPPRLYVHRRCRVLIESLERYSWEPDPSSEKPQKGKGFDHAADALRYMIQMLDAPSKSAFGNFI
jgi:hypothetical protein